MIRETCLEARAVANDDTRPRQDASRWKHIMYVVYIFKKNESYNVISSDFIISILLRALRQVSLINIYTWLKLLNHLTSNVILKA